MTKLKTGIVGCGMIFPMHAHPVSQNKYTDLVAVCDIDEEKGARAAQNFNCRYYSDYREMIAKEQLDVLHICLPHYLHAPVAIYALSHGINVLSEKPMAIPYSDAEAMAEASKTNKKVLGVIMQNRYNPGSVLIKESLSSGKLGAVLGARCQVIWSRGEEYYSSSDWKGTWDREGGGVIINQALHTLDLMRWFVGEDISYIDANISRRLLKSIEVEDTAEGVIGFKNGVCGLFYASNNFSTDTAVEIQLHCEKGVAHMREDSALITYNDGSTVTAAPDPGEDFELEGVKSYWGVSHIKQINSFYNSLVNGTPLEVSLDESLKTHKMIHAIYCSGKTRNKIEF